MNNHELLTVVKEHLKRYPKMQPQDIVKLLYQNEFGPGHLVTDRASCMKRLKDEAIAVQQDEATLLIEDIGNGLARVNLARLASISFSLEDLADVFIRSAAEVTGDKDRFISLLELLKDNFGELEVEFPYEELDKYLEKYIASGCPMVSHSELYRQEYSPAYRVVKTDLLPKNLQSNKEE